MFRRICSNSILLIGVAGTTLVSTTEAQEFLPMKAEQEVSRVLDLKNQFEVKANSTVSDFSARANRMAQNPITITAPPAPSITNTAPSQTASSRPSVAYDEIDSSMFKPRGATMESDQSATPTFAQPATSDKMFAPKLSSGTPERVAANKPFGVLPKPATTGTLISAPISRNESAPLITTNISAPEFINVNETATVQIDVKNAGNATVDNIKLMAMLPADISVDSRQGSFVDGKCTFEIESLRPGQKRQLTMAVKTKIKRSLDIQTELMVSSKSSVTVGVRQPQLTVSIEGPKQTNIGQKAVHIITVTNIGDGVATDVNLVADIPQSMRVIEKSGFERPETLRPGEKATAKITSMPREAGAIEMAFAAEGVSVKADPAKAGLRVMQPELRVAAIGPDMNFVERDGIYTITVDNPGEVDINNVKVQFVIPDGFKVTTISRQAKMDSATRTLTWNFDQIKAQAEQSVQLKAIATTNGDKFCRIRVASDETNEKEISLKTMIATRAELGIQMKNIGGPVQVGNEATFVVVVENRGSSLANDLEIEVQLPAGMRPASPKDGVVDEDTNSILFADSALAAGKSREFRFSAVGVAKGEHIVRSSLQTVDTKQRIIVENSVFVYEPAQARVSESMQSTVPR